MSWNEVKRYIKRKGSDVDDDTAKAVAKAIEENNSKLESDIKSMIRREM
ncbi:hypothetical protein [Halobacillus seohaensis]